MEIFRQFTIVRLAEGLGNARRHGIIEIGDTLSAVHFVLIGLNCNTRQRGITADVVRLPKETVPCTKSTLKKLEQINLTAGFCQHIKIFVMDVDIAVDVR